MEWTFYSEPVTFCIIKNYHSSEVCQSVLKELDALKPHLKGPEHTAGGLENSGQIKKANSGLFLERFLNGNIEKSAIMNAGSKLFRECLYDLKNANWFYKYIERVTHISTLVSYYKTGDFYKSHEDNSLVSAIYYIWKEPKSFHGGELYFGDFKVPIENNCLVIFPSCTEHRVTEVSGEGRWSITQFMDSQIKPNQDIILFNNFLNRADFTEASRKIEEGSWTYSNVSLRKSAIRFFMMELTNDAFFRVHIKNEIENKTGKRFRLLKVYANGQVYGQDGDFHKDDIGPNKWTFLIYLNMISEAEIETWGGETQFVTQDMLRCQPPLPNLGVLFKSEIWHRGMAPSKPSNGLRVTIAWKLEEVPGARIVE
jgi:hypothetical protein